jgi:hypothetical protein
MSRYSRWAACCPCGCPANDRLQPDIIFCRGGCQEADDRQRAWSIDDSIPNLPYSTDTLQSRRVRQWDIGDTITVVHVDVVHAGDFDINQYVTARTADYRILIGR